MSGNGPIGSPDEPEPQRIGLARLVSLETVRAPAGAAWLAYEVERVLRILDEAGADFGTLALTVRRPALSAAEHSLEIAASAVELVPTPQGSREGDR